MWQYWRGLLWQSIQIVRVCFHSAAYKGTTFVFFKVWRDILQCDWTSGWKTHHGVDGPEMDACWSSFWTVGNPQIFRWKRNKYDSVSVLIKSCRWKVHYLIQLVWRLVDVFLVAIMWSMCLWIAKQKILPAQCFRRVWMLTSKILFVCMKRDWENIYKYTRLATKKIWRTSRFQCLFKFAVFQ